MFLLQILAITQTLYISPAHAEFAPANAADQQVITSLSMQFEADQYRAVALSFTLAGKAEVSREQASIVEKRFQRAEKLHESGHITEVDFTLARLNLLAARKDAARLAAESREAQADAEVSRLRLLQEGNPGRNLLSDLVQARIHVGKLRIAGHQEALVFAEEEFHVLQGWLKNGGTLKGRAVISERELEDRALKLIESEVRTKTLKELIRTAQTHLAALEDVAKTQSKMVVRKEEE